MSRLDARGWTLRPGQLDPEHREEAWAAGIDGGKVWSADYEGTTILGFRQRGERRSQARWYAQPERGPRRGPYATRSEAAITVDVSRLR